MDSTEISHFVIYNLAGIISYNYSLYEESIISTIIFGWSIFGILSIGHDLLHRPNKRINRILAFYCLDMILFNSKEWIRLHNKVHHGNLKGDNDIMQLTGNNIIDEWTTLINSHVLKTQGKKSNHIYRIPFYIMLYHLRLHQVMLVYITIFFCLAYFTYATHNCSIESDYPKGSIEHNLNNTWDIYPESWLCSLIFGGINAHATHHCYPMSGRGEYKSKSKILANKYPKYYRSINNLNDLYKLYSNRFNY